jgi:hypothetical protein
MAAMKTPFTDAIETVVPKGSADNTPMPSSGGTAITNSPFGDALETKVPNTRTGGMLPECSMDRGIAAPVPSLPEPGKTFKIG